MKKRKRGDVAIIKQARMLAVEEDMINGMRRQGPLAVRHGVTQGTISNDMREIYAQWKQENKGRVPKLKLLRIGQLEGVLVNFIDSFKRSRHDQEKIATTYTPEKCPICKDNPGMDPNDDEKWCSACGGDEAVMTETITRTVTGQAGDAGHLRGAKETIVEIAKLEGLHPPKETKKQVDKRTMSVNVVLGSRKNGDEYQGIPREKVIAALVAEDELDRLVRGNGKAIDVESKERKEES